MPHSDTGECDIEAMCVKWCKILFLAPKDWEIPLGEHLDALSKDEPQEIPLGLPFTSVASHFVQKVRETAVETIKAQEDAGILRIKQEVKTGRPVLAQQRKLSIKVESLRALNLGLSWYPPATPLSRIRRYTFFCVTRFLGKIPYNALIAVGTLLYNQKDVELRGLFSGGLSPDERQADKWREKALKIVKEYFPEKGRWGPEYLMRPASEVEKKHMELVLNGVAADIYGQHSINFCNLYDEVISSDPIAAEHRRTPEIEAKAEHLIVCTTCGGIAQLIKKKYMEKEYKGITAPKLALHVPEHIRSKALIQPPPIMPPRRRGRPPEHGAAHQTLG